MSTQSQLYNNYRPISGIITALHNVCHAKNQEHLKSLKVQYEFNHNILHLVKVFNTKVKYCVHPYPAPTFVLETFTRVLKNHSDGMLKSQKRAKTRLQNISSERPLSKLSVNHKINVIGPTELKLHRREHNSNPLQRHSHAHFCEMFYFAMYDRSKMLYLCYMYITWTL